MRISDVARATQAITLLAALVTSPALALNEPTHDLINKNAVEFTQVDDLVRNHLGLPQGLDTAFTARDGARKSVVDWLGEGGIQADQGTWLDVLLRRGRLTRHFHDPLQSWDTAGLRHPLLGQFESSVRWMQRTDQRSLAVGGNWSWRDAREHYWSALTSSDLVTVEQEYADTFRALGQLMHVVTDASVPEHTRNDPHPLESICRTAGFRCYGNYEYWVSDQQGKRGSPQETAFIADFLSSPFAPDPAILQQPTGDALALVPVARLIDTNTYVGIGTGPNVTLGPAIGIAEVANANFFSEDTGHPPAPYPYPNLATLNRIDLPAPTGRIRAYFEKGANDGLAVSPVLAECVLNQATGTIGNCTDEVVWAQVADQMLPRAMGYSAALLDYFFRGQLEIAPPARFVYGLVPFPAGNAGAFTKLRFQVRSATPDEGTGSGQLVAVVRYRTSPENLIERPYADLSAPLFAVSRPVDVDVNTLTSSFKEFMFDFTESPIPTNSADLFLTVAYRGPVGLEADAVMVGGKDLFEPDPLDRGNTTDYDCFDGNLTYVVNLPPYHPPAHTERDVNGDQVQDLFGPWVERGQYTKTFDLSQAFPTPSEGNFDFKIPELSGGQYGRFMLLQDQPTYGVAALDSQDQEIPTGAVVRNDLFWFAINGVYNTVVQDPGGGLVRRLLLSASYRGVPFFHDILYANANTYPCLPQTQSLDPPLTRVEGTVAAE